MSRQLTDSELQLFRTMVCLEALRVGLLVCTDDIEVGYQPLHLVVDIEGDARHLHFPHFRAQAPTQAVRDLLEYAGRLLLEFLAGLGPEVAP